MTSSDDKAKRKPRPYFWERDYSQQTPEGKDLAALRSGLGREAGDVPAMWRYYTQLRSDGRASRELRAEHAALVLFAMHQQSQSRLMHQPNVGLGSAMAKLRASGRYTTDAVDKRFGAAATATSFTEVVAHLRGLVSQLRTLSPAQPLDYSLLSRDLRDWQDPDRIHRVRRRWGSQYFTFRTEADAPAEASTTAKA
ncbi:type I-E CRISPR-associated protein Cse2/CasB [Micromonospora sp. NPDC052213]|uniref:type I-E CRISPR-associated protein Cse2/CasB n=1 Tax=Micromonospora sp. NPDC052213 TaxID=3155812 RepID=UPI003444EBC9